MIKFRIFNTEVGFTYGFFCAVILLVLSDVTGMFFVSYIAVILHEAGHFFVLYRLKTGVCEVTFGISGVKTVKRKILSEKETFLVAFAGPAVNLILFALYFSKLPALKYFAVVNLLIGVFNLLPVRGLDGGDITEYLLRKSVHKRVILNAISVLTVTVLLVFAILLTVYRYANITVLICGVYLFILSILSFFEF